MYDFWKYTIFDIIDRKTNIFKGISVSYNEYLQKEIPKMDTTNENNNKNTKGTNKDFPLTKLGVAEEILPNIERAGGKITSKTLSDDLDVRGGAFARKLSSIKRWGLVAGSGMLTLTELGNSILHPISDEELAGNRKKAFMQIPLFKELYDRFGLNLPEDKTFIAILIREYEIKWSFFN